MIFDIQFYGMVRIMTNYPIPFFSFPFISIMILTLRMDEDYDLDNKKL
jgi:hypothetical protein